MLLTFVLFLQDSEKYVEQLLTLFNRFSKLVKEAFQDDPRFLTSRDKVSLKRIYPLFQTIHFKRLRKKNIYIYKYYLKLFLDLLDKILLQSN